MSACITTRAKVCQTSEDYQGYDGELGLCVCKEPPGRASCEGLCRVHGATQLRLWCRSNGSLELEWSNESHVSSVSGSTLETLFKQWDSQGNLQCPSQQNSSRPIYIVHTSDAGFLGILSGLPKELQQMFPDTKQADSQSSGDEGRRQDLNSIKDMVLNPVTCLHLDDVILFIVDTLHYPQYDINNLYNTNSVFDWGTFEILKEELSLSWTPPKFFSVVFMQPGVYVFTLSSHQYKHLYVRVMPEGAQCYEPGPFFPPTPHHMTRMGISRRRDLLLRPDWLVTGGILCGAVFILCLCVTVLILFREYGWPEKVPIQAQYRRLQLSYLMDDYSSKGSRVILLQKTHRNQQARVTQDSVCADTLDDFWDYEQQVDLEAFCSSTFYNLLMKQSLSITSKLGQLTSEVKELYQGVLGKLQLLHPQLLTEEKVAEGYEMLRREIDQEVVQRKSLGSQLRALLDGQLQALRREQQAQQKVHSVFTSQLRECTRLLSKIDNNNQQSCELSQQILIQRLTTLVGEMGELVLVECQRQGSWGLLGEGTGAKLLCPDTGNVLTKNDLFDPDGSLSASHAVYCDSVTGLIRPNAQSHMLLSNGHTMAVPPDFCIHPHTGRVLPIIGNVAYDPVSSTLVFTTDLYADDNRKWDTPVLAFIPYPMLSHSDLPLPSSRLKGLKPGQRPQLCTPMAEPETGVPVPILAVTIHPQTGLVYPLGKLHLCPVTRIPQPIQIGYPILDSRTGNLVLTVGVTLDPVKGDVLPVGGVLLAEPFIEPLSGHLVKVAGATIRGGLVVPSAGGYQNILDNKVLAMMHKIFGHLKPLAEVWGSDPNLQLLQTNSDSESSCRRQDLVMSAAKELHQAWVRSLHWQLQLQSRLEILLDWSVCLQENGGVLGEMPLPGSDGSVPALLGMEYPDPMGSGLGVQVLGCQADWSGKTVPLAGTMEDPDGKGLVAIRYGSQTIDPVTGLLSTVVGARLDPIKKHTVPITASYWLMETGQSSSLQVEALQREVCLRNTYWQQQKQREEDILSDVDSSLHQCLLRLAETNLAQQLQWSGRQQLDAAVELHDSAQIEAQRKAAQRPVLDLVLPLHVSHILTLGDEDEWDQQCIWHSVLLSGLEKLEICMYELQQDQEKERLQTKDWPTNLNAMEREQRQRELCEQICCRQTELHAALSALHSIRVLSQLRTIVAKEVLCRNLWFREYGLIQHTTCRLNMRATGLLHFSALPLIEKLIQLLEEKQSASFSSSVCNQQVTESLQQIKETVQPTQISVPTITEEQWRSLLERSPLFQQLKGVELQLKGWACRAGLQGKVNDGVKYFIDVLDAQWECEGELIPLDPSTLKPREFLVYKHGLFLIHSLHNLQLTPAISLQIAASLPNNNYCNNSFRNSFFYQEAEDTLFVRRQRLQSVGGFSLMLLHCLSHIKIKELSSDSTPAFQRLFFKLLQECLGEVFQARLCKPLSEQEANLCVWGQEQEAPAEGLREIYFERDFQASSLLNRINKPGRAWLSDDDAERVHQKHKELSLFTNLEELLSEKTSVTTEKTGGHSG
ncbi:uncharacterized protein LOC114474973 [Gouania willdenowi]|uniref:uncharacterized protein LOC114474973 n=1 Tax=Gouania willdenowi TaxID=441366 RepID=UPI0010553783|nr:uncharacterized protein LOC114474973 [Gouania willdenowi]